MGVVGNNSYPLTPHTLYYHDHFGDIRHLWAPVLENQNSRTLLVVYIEGMTIPYRNKIHKIKNERGV